MKLPLLFNKNKNPNPYAVPAQESKKKMLLLIGGGIVVLAALYFVVFRSGGTPGAQHMRTAVQDMGDALAAIQDYDGDLSYAETKNDAALINNFLQADYKALNDLYNRAYSPKNKLPANPKLDKEDEESLDSSKNSNLIDTALFDYVKPKLESAYNSLQKVDGAFNKQENNDTVKQALQNLKTSYNIIDEQDTLSSS